MKPRPAANNLMAYIGVFPCGCVASIIVDDPQYRTRVACMLRDWALEGCSIERMTVGEANDRWTGLACPKCKERYGSTD